MKIQGFLGIILLGMALAVPAQGMSRARSLMGQLHGITQAVEVPPRIEHGEIVLKPMTQAEKKDAKIEAEINADLTKLMNPLADAYYNGTSEDLAKAIKASTNINADIEATRDQNGYTILDDLITDNRFEVIKMIVHKGARLDNYRLIKLLGKDQLPKGIIRLEDILLPLAVSITTHSYKMVINTVFDRILRQEMRLSQTLDFIKGYLKLLDLINFKHRGTPLLILAAECGNTKAVELLLKTCDTHVHAKDVNGFTAFMLAIKFGHFDAAQLLLDAGANINDTCNGMTALIWSVLSYPWMFNGVGGEERVAFLLRAGADCTIEDEEGRTALTISKAHGYTKLIKMLQAAESQAMARKVASLATMPAPTLVSKL